MLAEHMTKAESRRIEIRCNAREMPIDTITRAQADKGSPGYILAINGLQVSPAPTSVSMRQHHSAPHIRRILLPDNELDAAYQGLARTTHPRG